MTLEWVANRLCMGRLRTSLLCCSVVTRKGGIVGKLCSDPHTDPHMAAGVRAQVFNHQRCGHLTETLPAMQYDPNRPEDVLKVDADEDGVGGDDSADALRYLVATKALTIAQRKLRGL